MTESSPGANEWRRAAVPAAGSGDARGESPWRKYHRNLPHWRMAGATYFVTWRLRADQPELSNEERLAVGSHLRHFHGVQYDLHAYVVMNDHVHVLLTPQDGQRLEDVLRSRKSFSAHELQRKFARSGKIWLDESFDRIVRDELELEEKLLYIVGNPGKRWPDITGYEAIGVWGDNY